MADVEAVVGADGSIVIPANAVAEHGLKPGEQVGVSLTPRSRKPSRGLLKGRLSSLTEQQLRRARALAVEDLEATRAS